MTNLPAVFEANGWHRSAELAHDGTEWRLKRWLGPGDPPTQTAIDAAVSAYEAQRLALAYKADRRAAYHAELPEIASDDPIDVIGHVLDDVIRELDALGQAVPGYAPTPEFASLVTKIADIKVRFPKAAS